MREPGGANPDQAQHVAALDGLRGLAILMVLFVHFIGDETPTCLVEGALVKLANYGVWGVDLFFVLSGFLITGILHDAKASPRYYRDFYVRRVLRIFPLYFGTLLLLFVVWPLLPVDYPTGLAEARRHQVWLWSYGGNLYLARAGTWALPYVSHFWSLAVEEHFYLLWPVIVRSSERTKLMTICLAGMAFATLLRTVTTWAGGSDVTSTVLTPCRIDAFCVGGLVALSVRGPGLAATARIGGRWVVPIAAIILLLSAWHAATGGVHSAIVLSLRGLAVACFFGALIAKSLTVPRVSLLGAMLHSSFARMLGKYSYGLYVFHGIIAYELHERRGSLALGAWMGSHLLAMLVQAALGMAGSLLVAAASYELMEKHFLELKRRFAPRPTPCTAPSQLLVDG
jgi:peptidoglycan/LPS O-acetylase OafA/YrhL